MIKCGIIKGWGKIDTSGHGAPCPYRWESSMNLEEFYKFFKDECQKNQIEFEVEKAELLYQYMKLILEWNEKINVTAIREEKEFIVKHFIDSLTISPYLKDAKRILDIGTGGGFPGIPLKIYHLNKKFTLIDSVNKKIMVINDVIEQLKLDGIEALHMRAEDLARDNNYREQFDVVTTRAVSNLATIAEYMLPFVKIGGKAICMKGPNIEQEMVEAQKAIRVLGGKIEKVEKLNISDEFERNLIILEKVKSTDKKYPRGQGKPAKEPIT